MKRSLVVEASAWIAALVVVAVILPLLSYGTRDADSRLYAEISARLSTRPLARWIAPEWPPGWYGTGYFLEHPVGMFLVPAALGAVGYPAPQAAYVVNALWQIGSLLLLAVLARRFATGPEARALLYLLQLIPIAFTYRVRANQEQLLLLLLLLALYAIDRVRTSWAWAPVVAGAFVGLVLVKGMVGLVALPVCVLWLLALGGEEARRRWVVRGGLALVGAVAAIGVAIAAYQVLYRETTGLSFLSVHLQRQMQPALAPQSDAIVAQKAYNLVWYAGRLVWFPFPWSLALLVAVAAGLRALLRGTGERRACAPRARLRRRRRARLRRSLQHLGPPRRPLHLSRVLRHRRGGRRGGAAWRTPRSGVRGVARALAGLVAGRALAGARPPPRRSRPAAAPAHDQGLGPQQLSVPLPERRVPE